MRKLASLDEIPSCQTPAITQSTDKDAEDFVSFRPDSEDSSESNSEREMEDEEISTEVCIFNCCLVGNLIPY